MEGFRVATEQEFTYFVEKYKNFMVPAAKIIIDETDVIKGMSLCINSIQVRNSLEAADSCSFTISNVYDVKNHKFDEEMKAKFKLGRVLKVQMGYSSDLTEIFMGYISDVSYSFGEECSISVTALDARSIMMKMGRAVIYKEMSYKSMIEDIMNRYQNIYKTLKVDSSFQSKQVIERVQRESDYRFIKDLAQQEGKDFYMYAGTVYVEKKEERAVVIPVVGWGEGLTSFHRSVKYIQKGMKVMGYDEQQQVRVETEVAGETYLEQLAIMVEDAKECIFCPEEKDAEALKKLAEKKEKEKKEKSQSGDGEMIGLPELSAGGKIKIKNTDSTMDGLYLLRSVTHSFGSDGYRTSFEIAGV